MKNIILNIFLLFSAVNAISQRVTFTATGPSNAQIGKSFYIQYDLKVLEEGSNFQYPKTNDFKLINVSTSRSTFSKNQFVKGKWTSENYIVQTWYLTMEAKETGTFTVPGASVDYNGKTYKSNSVTINVSEGRVINNQNTNSQNNSISNNVQDEQANLPTETKDLFINVSTDKNSVYVGEAIYSYCKMFSRYNVNIQDISPSSFDNFWIKDIKIKGTVQAQQIRLNNKTYLTATIDKKIIFPQKSGKIEISPYDVTFQLYDDWGFPSVTKKVVSNRKVLNVKPLPDGKPVSFSGAVGNFSISSEVDKRNVATDDAFTLKLTIKGQGNFGLFDLPVINLPKSFEALDPDSKNNITVSQEGVSGNTEIKYAFIARVPGYYKIPKIEFSYFNPSTAKYYTLYTDTLSIKVIGDTSKNNLANKSNIQKSEVTELGNDIRYIKTSLPKFRTKNDFLISKDFISLAFIIPFLIFVLIIVLLRKKIKENADLRYVKYKTADKVSKKKLKNAEKFMKINDTEKFYEEISKALWGYVSDKFSIALSQLTRNNLVEMLQNKSVKTELIDEFIKLIDTCETARFAPVVSEEQMTTIYNRASDIINFFEKDLLKRP